MFYHEIINERIKSRSLRDAAFAAVFSAVRDNEPDKRIKEIETALQFVSEPYTSQWKSGIKNARGYEFNKITLDITVKVGPKNGGGFTSKVIDFDGQKLTVAKMYLVIFPDERLFEDKINTAFATEFANMVADMFTHEMIHYTQTVKVGNKRKSPNTEFTLAQKQKITNVQSMPLDPEESANLSDEQRDRYYAKINEIDAYAANAAASLIDRLGAEKAKSMMHDIASLAPYSSEVARYIKRVKDKRPKAWKRFLTQLAWNLDHYSTEE